jgi:hypothetical protein
MYGRRELDVLHTFTHAGAHHGSAQPETNQDSSGWTGLRAGGILALLTGVGVTLLVSVGRRPAKPSGRDLPPDSRTVNGGKVPVAGTNRGGRG